MGEHQFQTVKTISFFVALGLVLAIELAAPWKRFAREKGMRWYRNLGLGGFNAALLSVVCGACVCSAARFAEGRGIGVLHALAAPRWLAIAVTVLSLDLLSWAWHAANHRVRALWRFHRVHHSDRVFDLTTSFRFHPGELLLSLPVRLTVVVALGAPVVGVLLFEIVFGLFNLFEHGNIRLPGPLERLLSPFVVHPALHRLHHSLRIDELNTNFGTTLTLWDRLFGTWRESRSDAEIETGIANATGVVGTKNTWALFAMPFARRG